MSFLRSESLLRRALLADALISTGAGLLMAVGAGFLTNLLGLPAELLRYAGLILLPYGACVAYIGTRQTPNRAAVWTIIGLNVLWTLDSILLLFGGWVAPSVLGYVFVLGLALVAAAFAELQYFGLRRSTSIAAT